MGVQRTKVRGFSTEVELSFEKVQEKEEEITFCVSSSRKTDFELI